MLLCAVTVALAGCAGHGHWETADRRDGRRNVVHGLVVPADAYSELGASRPVGDRRDWIAQRNDHAVNPQPALQSWSLQYMELRHDEDLRVINGRPRGHTSTETRAFRVRRQR